MENTASSVPAERIRELMTQLDSLIDGEAASAKLAACGPAAVEPLRCFLLAGQPSGVPQPRCWAVRALWGLGATDVLIEYLEREPASDPVIRLAEEAVQRQAALVLASSGAEDVFQLLLRLARRQSIPGVIEALGRFNRREAVPLFLHALEDDFCRPWAEAALEGHIDRDRDLLLRSALEPVPDAIHETRASLRRRRALLLMLRGQTLTMEEAHALSPVIDSADVELAVSASAIVLALGTADDRRHTRRRLEALEALAPWDVHSDIRTLLNAPLRDRSTR